MYYILYRLDNLKVVYKDTKPLKPQDMNVFGIAEYNGEIPKNNWLTVDNVREEIETWKEKEIQYKTVKVLEPQEKYIVVYKEQPLLDEQSNPIIDEDGNPIVDEEGNPIKQQVPKRIKQVVNVEVEKEIEEEVEVEKSKTHIVCDLVAHFYPKRELTEEQKAKQKEKQYNALVTKYIRQKYDANDVEALYANYLAEPNNEKYITEFNQFQSYRIECKTRAKEEV